MFSCVLSAALAGVVAEKVRVETDISNGFPCLSMVGYPSVQVKEALERVRTALRNEGMTIPPKRVTVNLAPANLRKEGSGFDLPVAAALLLAMGRIPPDSLEHTLVVGELGLDGSVRKVNGVLPMVLMAAAEGCHCCIVPADNRSEASLTEDMTIIGVHNLKEVMDFCSYGLIPEEKDENQQRDHRNYIERIEDFSDICGQNAAKRAAVIAAAGFHNLMLVGAPGSGKTMIAKRIPGILPPLTEEEWLEVLKIESVAGILTEDRVGSRKRPFRAPHYTITSPALVGGGRIGKPGEVTLAHRGVLFLDEIAEMPRKTVELLRQPLQDKSVIISRLNGEYEFPADFLFVAAMNSCPCGGYPDMNRCSCTQAQIDRYRRKISQPILERIDLCVEIAPVSYEELRSREGTMGSKEMRVQVEIAREIQEERFKKMEISFNSQMKMEDLDRYCAMEKSGEKLLEKAFRTMHLSVRSMHNIIKVARTLADLDGGGRICEKHVTEAIFFRGIDKDAWKA